MSSLQSNVTGLRDLTVVSAHSVSISIILVLRRLSDKFPKAVISPVATRLPLREISDVFKDPAVKLVATMFVAANIPELTDVDPTMVVAKIDPELIPVLATSTPAETLVTVILAKADKPEILIDPVVKAVAERLVTVAFVAANKPELTDVDPTIVVAKIDPELIPVLATSTPAETLVAVISAKADNPEALIDPVVRPVLATSTPTETLVAVILAKADKPETLIDPVVKAVAEMLVTVAFVAANIPELTDVPTLRVEVTESVPVEIFVSTTFVVVILTVVNVPPINASPERLKVPPVIILAKSVPTVIVVLLIFVATTDPDV